MCGKQPTQDSLRKSHHIGTKINSNIENLVSNKIDLEKKDSRFRTTKIRSNLLRKVKYSFNAHTYLCIGRGRIIIIYSCILCRKNGNPTIYIQNNEVYIKIFCR